MRKHVVIKGVSSSGKSTVGELLAQRTGLPFRDGDEMHPAANIYQMASGKALDDADRKPWLESLAAFSRTRTPRHCGLLRAQALPPRLHRYDLCGPARLL